MAQLQAVLAVLTPRQKQVVGGGLMLALGLATGVAIAPDDPQRDDKLADVAAKATTNIPAGKPVDVAEYHRVVSAARAGRGDIADLLTADVQPGATVTADVNVEIGARPSGVEYTGAAAGRFETVSLTYEDMPGSTLHDGTTLPGATRVVLVARNASTEALRLTAFVQYAKGP